MDLTLRAEQNSGTTPIRAGFELDIEALQTWLADHIPSFAPPLQVEQFRGGQSNPTYKLSARSGRYVLRTKPKGPLLKSAHAIDREYRVMRALAGTDVPVPATFALCDDDAVIGRGFYVMGFGEGRVIWDLPAPRWTPNDRRALWQAGADAAARLHSVDYAAAGLADYGKVGGYVARQLARWTSQYEHTRDGIENPEMDWLAEWLPARLPKQEPTAIVHGDLQLSNMIMAPDRAGVVAIIDWELSTLGNPISDFAYYCRDYHIPREDGGYGGAPEAFGIAPEKELLARWSASTGFDVGDD